MDERTRQLLTQGREHFDNHEFDKADDFLRQVERGAGNYADVHNMLGIIAYDRGHFEEARSWFEKAVATNPKYTEAALNLAVTYNEVGQYEQAKAVYQTTLERGAASPGQIDPFVKGKLANLHGELARAYADAALFSEATHELRKAVLLCPQFPDLRVRLANLHRQQGDNDAARFELLEAVKIRPNYVVARNSLGVVLLTLGDKLGARSQWEAVLRIDPDNKAAQMYLRTSE